MALLTLTDASRTYDAERPLLEGVSMVVREGDRIGLIGPNGSGKSTLLRILAGVEEFDGGSRTLRRGLRLGHLEQEPELDPDTTVWQVVNEGLAERNAILQDYEAVCAALEGEGLSEERLRSLLGRQERLQQRLDLMGGHQVDHLVDATLEGVGLQDPRALCGRLSGGEARRVALARLLVSAPDLLLLDEPTNHLDAFVVAWLEERLVEWRVPLVLVTHDRYLLQRVVERIVEIDRGSLHDYEGSYGRYLTQRAERLQAEERAEHSRVSMLRRETEWMRRGPPARTTKAKARIQRYEALADGAPRVALDDLAFAIPPGPRLGAKVVELQGIAHRYGQTPVVPTVDLTLEPGMRLGLVGPNGAGKSTLVKILLGRLEPSEGQVVTGETVRFGVLDQGRSDLDPQATVVEEVAGPNVSVRVGDTSVHVVSYLDRFLFPGARKHAKVGALSGGERGRLLLAKLVLSGANVLVLDEPTNDLDLATLRALEEALCAFPGSVVVVSHDRWFLDRVATHVLHLDGEGGATLHTGDVTSLLDRLARESVEGDGAAPAAAGPSGGAGRRGGSTGGGKASRTPAKGSPSATPGEAAVGTSRPRSLAPWERRELDAVTEKVETLEASLGELDERLADPELYGGDGTRARALQEQRAEMQAALDQALGRWEELAERA